MTSEWQNSPRVMRVTEGPAQNFFGYYDKHQWDESGRYLLTLQVDIADRSPQPGDVARIAMIDLEDRNRFIELGDTRAWSWQQGAMLQWLPGSPTSIIYNDRIADRFVAIIQDVHTGAKRVLPRPIYTVSNDGKWGLSLNFSRLAWARPGYGYNGLPDVWQSDPCPEDDGIYLMNLETGEHELIVSIASLAAHDPVESMAGASHWVNHLLFNPSGERFIFLHRWRQEGQKGWTTRFYTANRDGSDRHLFTVNTASHFIWRDDEHILLWASTEELGGGYYLLTDKTYIVEPVARSWMRRDGHCTYSPDGKWILTDAYPDTNRMRPLLLYNVERDEMVEIASFYSPPESDVEWRTDLHPRWSRDGRWVCVDSSHEGRRQVYLVDVADIVSSDAPGVPHSKEVS